MNHRFIVNQLGLLLLVLSGFLAAVGAGGGIAWWAGDADERAPAFALLISAAVGAMAGLAAWTATRRVDKVFQRREAIVLVASSWLLGALLSALPYLLWGYLSGEDSEAAATMRRPVECFFESMSGLTTTGATVLVGLDEMPGTILFWRGLTHWIGGLGIVVFFVAVLPSVGAGVKRLFLTEAGSSREGVRPKIRDTARLLLYIYLGLTVAQVAALKLAGMGWLDAAVHTFSSLASGGFSNYDASVGAFGKPVYEWIIIVFMILGAVNFGLYYDLIRRRFDAVRKDPEIRLYLGIIVVAASLVWLQVLPHAVVTTSGAILAPGAFDDLRYVLFNTVSIQTTTGFATTDYARWPTLATGMIVLLMFIGGSAGSTAGGIKVIRIWIAFRIMLAAVERSFRPHVIRPLRVGGVSLDDAAKLETVTYILGIVLIWLAGSAGMLLWERAQHIDFTTAFTATSACLFTTGPGLSRVGPVMNYAWMTDTSKLWLSAIMLIGRLEVLTIIVLFTPRFWRETF